MAVLEAVGERVAVPSSWACCGRPLYDAGMLGLARRSLTDLLDVLEPWTSRGVPVVVAGAELPGRVPGRACPRSCPTTPGPRVLASLARSPAEHLLASPAFEAAIADGQVRRRGDGQPARAVVHPHCHGRAIGTPRADRELLERLGFRPEMLDAGCCGLAGSFGYRAEHEALSRRIGEEQWLPKLRSALVQGGEATLGPGDATVLVVDGFSCQMQLDQLSDLRSTALVSLVRRALGC